MTAQAVAFNAGRWRKDFTGGSGNITEHENDEWSPRSAVSRALECHRVHQESGWHNDKRDMPGCLVSAPGLEPGTT
jgi:hypothetical protein